MPRTIISSLSLECDANIEIKKEECSNTTYKFILRDRPCFGRFTHSDLNDDRSIYFKDIKADVYQTIDDRALSNHVNNYCSLTPQQLSSFHRDLEYIFKYSGKNTESGIHITTEEGVDSNKEIFPTWEFIERDNVDNIKYIKIHIEADRLTSYQLLCLLTAVRTSSEYPNALLLRECYNMREHGLFLEFSPLSLFALCQNRLRYEYDQGLIQNWVHRYDDDPMYFHKPICLKRMQERMTPGTPSYEDTNLRIQKFFPMEKRSAANIRNHEINYYMGGGNSIGTRQLYEDNTNDINPIFAGDIVPQHVSSYERIRDAIYAKWSRLKVDFPEFKNR